MRFIARLDIKNEYVIKGINLEGLRKIGDPLTIAKEYYQKKVDEIIFIDNVASLYRRNNLFSIIEKSVKEILKLAVKRNIYPNNYWWRHKIII